MRNALFSGAHCLIELSSEQDLGELQERIKATSHSPSILTINLTGRSAYRFMIAGDIVRFIKEKRAALDEALLKSMETALHELATNAIVHGNLALQSHYDNSENMSSFYNEIQRSLKTDLGDKRIEITIDMSETDKISFSISDEGAGFDHAATLNNLARESVENPALHGMGLNLLKQISSQLTFDRGGTRAHVRFDCAATADQQTGNPAFQLHDTAKNHQIMLVDDMKYNRYVLRNLLELAGYTHIIEASSAEEALALLRIHTPDLIISDLMMPIMDGAELCAEIRKIPRLVHVPVIVQTAMMNIEDRVRAFKFGADDIIVQPVHSEELMARLEMHLARADSYMKLEDYRMRIEQEIEQARQMHISLLPQPKLLGEIEAQYRTRITSYFQPSSEIGGDLWGVYPLCDNQLSFYICDFTGHGVGSAINTFRFNTTLPTLNSAMADPEKFTYELNNRLVGFLSTEQFATFFYGLIDVTRGTLTYCSAGAPNPILYQYDTQHCSLLDSSGLPLGIIRNREYPAREIAFSKDDAIFLYSDALTETKLPQTDGFLSEDSIMQCIESHMQTPLAQRQDNRLIHQFLKQLGILDGAVCADDLTLTLITQQ